MIVLMLISIVGGLVIHQTRRFTDSLARGWSDMTNDAIGVLAAFPFAFLFYRWTRPNDGGVTMDEDAKFTIAYFFGFVFFGIGVVLGWLIDTIKGA